MVRAAISIVIPVLNESENIASLCSSLLSGPAREEFYGEVEIIVVDGDSIDGTVTAGQAFPDVRLLTTRPNRAHQMNAGAEAAVHDRVLFLHADTRLPPGGLAAVSGAFDQGAAWGYFPVRIRARGVSFRIIEFFFNLRVFITGGATGDQAIFLLKSAAGERPYKEIPVMEDLDLVRRLRRSSPGAVIPLPVTTSARRWLTDGILSTVLRMWLLRLAFHLGVSPARLARYYRPNRAEQGAVAALQNLVKENSGTTRTGSPATSRTG